MANGVIIPTLRLRTETATVSTDSNGIGWTSYDLTNCIDICVTDGFSNMSASKIKSPNAGYNSGIRTTLYNGNPYQGTFNVKFTFIDV